MAPPVIRTTLYLSFDVHKRLRLHAAALDTSMSVLVEHYALEGLLRDALTDAAEQVHPTRGALDAIRARIDQAEGRA